MVNRQSLVSRRTFLGSAALAMAAPLLLRPRTVAAGACQDLKPDYTKLVVPGSAAEDESQSLAKAIMVTLNTEYAASDIYVWREGNLTQLIQRDSSTLKYPLTWEFNSRPEPIYRAMRIPYSGTAKKGKQCTPEHVLVGLRLNAPGLAGPATPATPWKLATGPNPKVIEVLGNFIVTTLTLEGSAALCYTGWSAGLPAPTPPSCASGANTCNDGTEHMWQFRGTPHHIESASRIPYVVNDAGALKTAWLYVGYEGGGGY